MSSYKVLILVFRFLNKLIKLNLPSVFKDLFCWPNMFWFFCHILSICCPPEWEPKSNSKEVRGTSDFPNIHVYKSLNTTTRLSLLKPPNYLLRRGGSHLPFPVYQPEDGSYLPVRSLSEGGWVGTVSCTPNLPTEGGYTSGGQNVAQFEPKCMALWNRN